MASPVPGFLNSGDFGNYGNYGNLLSVSTTPAPSQISSSTPILDRLVPPPAPLRPNTKREKPRWLGYLIAVLAVLVPAAWIYLMMNSAMVLRWSSRIMPPIERVMNRMEPHLFPSGASELVLMWNILSPGVAILAVLVVHELGHVIAGKLTGFQFVAMHFGQLEVTPPFRFTWLKKDPYPHAPASVLLLPLNSQRLRSRTILMTLGGAAANFISASPALFIPHPGVFLAWFALFSVIAGIENLLPFSLRSNSDGKQILRLLRNTGERERLLALQQLMSDLHGGVEPQNLDSGFLGLATALQDNSVMTVHSHNMAYLAAYYRHDDTEAARLLEICLQHSGLADDLTRESLLTEAAIFQARRRNRIDLARQWLADIPSPAAMPERKLNAETAILIAEGDIQGALKKLDEAIAMVEKSAQPGGRDLTLRFLSRTRKELEEKLAATT
jgi:hypothetical protein